MEGTFPVVFTKKTKGIRPQEYRRCWFLIAEKATTLFFFLNLGTPSRWWELSEKGLCPFCASMRESRGHLWLAAGDGPFPFAPEGLPGCEREQNPCMRFLVFPLTQSPFLIRVCSYRFSFWLKHALGNTSYLCCALNNLSTAWWGWNVKVDKYREVNPQKTGLDTSSLFSPARVVWPSR